MSKLNVNVYSSDIMNVLWRPPDQYCNEQHSSTDLTQPYLTNLSGAVHIIQRIYTVWKKALNNNSAAIFQRIKFSVKFVSSTWPIKNLPFSKACRCCQNQKSTSNEAPSDVNKWLDVCTYPGWKMPPIAHKNIFFDIFYPAGYHLGPVATPCTDGASLF